MVSSRVRTVVLGPTDMGIERSLPMLGGLLVLFLTVGMGYHWLLDMTAAGWPKLTINSVVSIGTVEIPLASVQWAYLLGLGLTGLIGSLVTALRRRGLLVSLAFGVVPFVGSTVAGTVYMGILSQSYAYLWESPMAWLGHVGVPVRLGILVGLLGFFLGRTVTWLIDENTEITATSN